MNCTPPKHRAARTAVSAALAGAFAATSAVMPQSAFAVPTLLFGESTYEARAEIVHPGVDTYRSNPPKAQLPDGDATKVEAFVTPVQFGPGWAFGGFGDGTPTNHPTEAFASARRRADGIVDLGASGGSEGPGSDDWGRITAEMLTTGRVTNTGGYGTANLSYTIPLIELAQRGTRFDGLVAEVDVDYFLAMYDVNDELLFDFSRRYTLTFDYFKPPTTFAIQTYTASADLLRDGGGLVDVTDNCFLATQCGKAVGPFSVSREYVLDTGDYLKWEIYANVYQVTGREGGGHALYGDPLAVTGGGSGLRLSPGTVPGGAVPEPPSWALLGLGGVVLAWRRRRKEAVSAG